MTSSSELLRKAKAILAKRQLAKRNLIDFVQLLDPNYEVKWFHRCIAEQLEKVQRRETKRLMLFVPPQHGKSQLSSRNFPAFCLGKNPDEKIGIISYSATIAEGFGKAVQRKMEEDIYRHIFPETSLGNGRDGVVKTNEFFEVKNRLGYVVSVGRGGPLTSKSIDIGIIDDPLKDRAEAQSPTIREGLWSWFTDVFETRLHNDSVQVLIQTRWHEDDLAGRLLARDGVFSANNPRGWVVVKFPAIRTSDQNSYDPRKVGEALWPEKHSLEKLQAVEKNEPTTFNSLYQQDPKPPKDILIYPNWEECDEFPNDCEVVFSGLDFGFSNDPTAWIRVGKMGKSLYLDELLYEKSLTNPEIADRMDACSLKTGETYADSAEPKSIAELRKLGIRVFPAIKGPDSLDAGIQKLKEYKVYVTRRSINLIREKNNYQWIVVGGKITNIPVDNFNHGLDAVRYAVFTKYSKRKLVTS